MNGTPRLRSAFPSTPQSAKQSPSQNASSPSSNRSGLQDISALGPLRTEPDAPLIPFETLDAPSQRFYIAAVYIALFGWRLYDFYHLTLDETESLWLFMKWITIDGAFLFGLPGMHIPWLEWSSMTMTVLFILHALVDGILMFRISVPLGAWAVALSKVLYDRELAISERYVKPASILHDPNLILGRTVIHILPEGSAILNPEQTPLSLDTSKYSDSVNLPIHINQTIPISIELVRYDFETGQNETITISAAQAKKMRKEAEKHHARTSNGPLVLQYPVKKTGLYKLQRVVDETKLEVRGRSFEALVVAKPSARVKANGLDRCRGELSDVSIEVEGTPPLRVKYRKTVNGEDRDISYQSIQPEDFVSPLMRQPSAGPLVLTGDNDLSWARSYKITVPLNETLIASGAWFYSIDEVTDACGNTVKYVAQEDEYEKPKSKATHLEKALIVHDRPRASFNIPDMQHPLRAPRGWSVDLPMKFTSTGKKLADSEYTLEYLFTRGEDMLPNAEHSIEAESRTVIMKNLKSPPQVKEPGLYTLRSVSSQFCAGEILEPASIMLVNPPEPQLSVLEEQITDTCAGRPIGLRINLDLVGTPPFDVEYTIHKKNDRQARVQYKRIEGLRGHLDFKPEVAGHYTYTFKSISDSVYKNLALRDVKFEQDVKPSVSAHFTDPSAKTSVCIDDSVKFDVRLQGEAPFTLEYEIVHNGKRQKYVEEIADGTYTIRTGELTNGGDYSVALVSVKDGMGCKETLQQDAKISVRQQKPKASFGHIEGKRSVKSLESKYLNLPLRLSGEGPWTVWYRDPQGLEHSKKTSNANDVIAVREEGKYEIIGIHDALCPGAIDILANSFEVSWIARPTVDIAENSLTEGAKGKMTRKDVCEGAEDSLEILFSGRPPFEVKYQEQIRPDSGSKSIRNKEMNVPMQSAHINLNTGQAGHYEYSFNELSDYNYDHDHKQHRSLVIQQRVNPRPSVTFSTPGKVYSFCQGEESGFDSEVVPITLTGQPPFTIDIEIRQRSKASKPYTHTISDIPTTSHKLRIPHDRLQPGNSALSIRKVKDGRGCERFMDYTVAPRVQMAVYDPPSITSLETQSDFCVGDRISFALSGVAPYSVFYEFEKASRKAVVQTGTFKRLAENPGNFTIVGVQDSASSCRAKASHTKIIHPMPHVRLSKGKDNRVDIHAGSEADLSFEFGGTPPFEFTYTRSENTKKSGGKPGAVLETRTLTSETKSLTIQASEEGTYEVIAIRDAYCSFAKPGSQGFAGSGKQKLLT